MYIHRCLPTILVGVIGRPVCFNFVTMVDAQAISQAFSLTVTFVSCNWHEYRQLPVVEYDLFFHCRHLVLWGQIWVYKTTVCNLCKLTFRNFQPFIHKTTELIFFKNYGLYALKSHLLGKTVSDITLKFIQLFGFVNHSMANSFMNNKANRCDL